MSPWAALARIWGRCSNTAADILLLVGCGIGLPGCSPAQNGPTRLRIPRCGLAERDGFEPSRPLPAYGTSTAAPSTQPGAPTSLILAHCTQRLARSTAAR